VADAGFVMMNDGSIGDAASGSTTRANADTVNLFTLFYNNCADADVPVQTSTGAATTRAAQGTANVAFNAHCRMVLPKALGRDLAVAGAGVGLTSRALGSNAGAETHTQTLGELVAHAHPVNIGGSGIGYNNGTGSSQPDAVASTTGAAGSGNPMAILSPRMHLNIMVCL
jgi:hypothetical protein